MGVIMAEDRIGVGKYSVRVEREHPALEAEVMKRLDVMQRELNHLQHAITRMKAWLPQRTNQGHALVEAVMDSRNWTVSLVMSHAFIQGMLAGLKAPAPDQVEKLAARAAQLGLQDAARNLIMARPGGAQLLQADFLELGKGPIP
jgi:hypothetical protein